MCPDHAPVSPLASPSRRGFLFNLGLALNVLGGILVGIPVLGYVLAPIRRFESGSTPGSDRTPSSTPGPRSATGSRPATA